MSKKRVVRIKICCSNMISFHLPVPENMRSAGELCRGNNWTDLFMVLALKACMQMFRIIIFDF